MTSRRDLILGGACVLGAAGAFGLTPHKRISLMGKAKLDDIVPRRFGPWVARDVSDLVAPQEDDSLIDELLASNPKFQALVAKSKASPRKAFSFSAGPTGG